jgi:hypothetical protein
MNDVRKPGDDKNDELILQYNTVQYSIRYGVWCMVYGMMYVGNK